MGLIRGMARTAAVAGTATAVSNRVSRRQAGRWADQQQSEYEQQQYQQQQYAQQQAYAAQQAQQAYAQQQAQQQAAQPAPSAASPDMDATIAQLKQLAELNSQGILTDAEFEAQKRRLL